MKEKGFVKKIIKNKHNLPFIILPFGLLIINYIFGTQNILDAHKAQFRGGICGACQTCMFRMKELACDKYYGFDFNYLILSIIIFSFALGLLSSFYNFNLKRNLLTIFLGTLGFIILIEITVHFLTVPVLYTEFMEGGQTLSYVFLLFSWKTSWIGLILLIFVISGIIGIIITGLTRFVFKLRSIPTKR